MYITHFQTRELDDIIAVTEKFNNFCWLFNSAVEYIVIPNLMLFNIINNICWAICNLFYGSTKGNLPGIHTIMTTMEYDPQNLISKNEKSNPRSYAIAFKCIC